MYAPCQRSAATVARAVKTFLLRVRSIDDDQRLCASRHPPRHRCLSIVRAQDASLKHTLQFGIGLHHAGLQEPDRRCVEALFVAGKIQVHFTVVVGNLCASAVCCRGFEAFLCVCKIQEPAPPSGKLCALPVAAHTGIGSCFASQPALQVLVSMSTLALASTRPPSPAAQQEDQIWVLVAISTLASRCQHAFPSHQTSMHHAVCYDSK